MAAFQVGQLMGQGWLLGVSGTLASGFGIALTIWPATGVLSLVWLIGFYALVFGFMLVGLAYQLYRMYNRTNQATGSMAA